MRHASNVATKIPDPLNSRWHHALIGCNIGPVDATPPISAGREQGPFSYSAQKQWSAQQLRLQ